MKIKFPKNYQRYIDVAMEEAEIALKKGEIPVGSVVVREDRVISRAHNQVEERGDITAHGEILVIRDASKKLGKYLNNTLILTTLEPCPMCLSAIIFSRIEKVVYLARDPIWGALGGIFDMRVTLHHVKGPLSEYIEYPPAEELLREFFNSTR